MLCLGIESSCDETALALVRDGRLIDSVLASQARLHSLFGGVVPELASREHYHYLAPLFDELMRRSGLRPRNIDVVAAARGPGLAGSLLVGVSFAKALALTLEKPFIGINHLHAHLLAVGLEHKLFFPALGILASGGHTRLYRIESPARFILLGRTLDDAAGEAFDKVGKFIGLPYPCGKIMDDLACAGEAGSNILPRPYLDNDNLDFSFSGLKTAAVSYCAKNEICQKNQEKLQNFCASFNLVVADTICIKARRAWRENKDIKRLWLAGGVAANTLLREKARKLAERHGNEFLVPAKRLCADNGAMIAYAAYLLASQGYSHSLDMEIIPRGRKIPDDMRKSGDKSR